LKQIFFVELKIALINPKVAFYHFQTFYSVPARSAKGMVQFFIPFTASPSHSHYKPLIGIQVRFLAFLNSGAKVTKNTEAPF